MENKKQLSTWRLVLTYFIGVGVVISVISLAINKVLGSFVNLQSLNNFLTYALSLVVNVVGAWVGVYLISIYINKSYILKEKKKVLKIAVILSVIFGVFEVALTIFKFSGMGSVLNVKIFREPLFWVTIGVKIIGVAIRTLFLYFLGDKYLSEKTTEAKEKKQF